MQDFRSQYEAPQTKWNNEQEVTMELATAGQRIGAYCVNLIITMLCYIPIVVAGINLGMEKAEQVASMSDFAILLIILQDYPNYVWMTVGLLMIYCVIQVVMMSKTGQSIGKRIVGIKVVTENGDNPGFVGTVLMREVVFNIILFFIGLIPFLGGVVRFCVWVAVFVMIFLENSNRRTLQDKLAKTLVVKA